MIHHRGTEDAEKPGFVCRRGTDRQNGASIEKKNTDSRSRKVGEKS
jgi:hypothetical protein